jgi:hypothetical protein
LEPCGDEKVDWWAVRDSNPGLPACKAGALNPLSRRSKPGFRKPAGPLSLVVD